MSYRKKKLIFIQTLLLFAAILLLYIFYYQSDIKEKSIEEVKIQNEKLDKLGKSNYFEDVEYKGIDANGNRYLLKSEVATFSDESPEIVNMVGMNATFYFKDGKILIITGKTGMYNNKTNDMNFREEVEVSEAENKLFATLDTTVRKVVLGNLPLLLTDTVGFIRKLPQQLMESFKSTLDEVREADLLIHVLDISHSNFEDHYRVVNETLSEIDKSSKPTVVVFNKIDSYLLPEDELEYPDGLSSLDALKKSWMAKLGPNKAIFISAQKKDNMDELRDILYKEVKEIFKVRYPYNNFLY